MKEGVDAMVHGLHGDIDPNRVSDHGMHDLGTTFGSHKVSLLLKILILNRGQNCLETTLLKSYWMISLNC